MAGAIRQGGILENTVSPGAAQARRRALEHLLRERQRLQEMSPAARDGSPDSLEMAQELEEERVWLAVLDRSCDARVQLDEALALLAEGRYGRCVDCGRAIPAARLRALPFALRCVTCQERTEGRATLAEHARLSRWISG